MEQLSRPLHEAIQFVIGNVTLQAQQVDVAFPYVAGCPGGGKTASIAELAKKHNYGLVSTHFALKPYEETGGIPQFETIKIDGKDTLATTWSFPDIMKSLYIESEKYKDSIVIWLLDDMHLCGSIHMALLYELLTERKLRDFKIPDNVAIVLAGNHGSNKAGSKTMFSAIVNRVCMLPVHTDFSGWKEAYASGVVHPAIISFLENKQFVQFFHEDEEIDSPWCSPRSWSRLSNIIFALETWTPGGTISEYDLLYIANGHVSKSAASEFAKYYSAYKNFNIKEIFSNIDDYEIPDLLISKYALAFSAMTYYIGLSRRVEAHSKFAKLIYKFMQTSPEMALMIMTEIFVCEKNKIVSNISSNIIGELRKIDQMGTLEFINTINSLN